MCLSVGLCLSVTSQCSIETDGQLVFGIESFFGLSYIGPHTLYFKEIPAYTKRGNFRHDLLFQTEDFADFRHARRVNSRKV